MPRLLACCAVAALVAGCASGADQTLHADAKPLGYHFRDGIHPNEISAGASAQAFYNAQHGVWLWPPTEGGRRN